MQALGVSNVTHLPGGSILNLSSVNNIERQEEGKTGGEEDGLCYLPRRRRWLYPASIGSTQYVLHCYGIKFHRADIPCAGSRISFLPSFPGILFGRKREKREGMHHPLPRSLIKSTFVTMFHYAPRSFTPVSNFPSIISFSARRC